MIVDPALKYGTVEIDFPWAYGNHGNSGGGMFGANGRRGICPTYRTMPLKQIAEWRLPFEVAESAHMYLWTPKDAQFMEAAPGIIRGLGFRPVNLRVWRKHPHKGPGQWEQSTVEFVWRGVRGPLWRRPLAELRRILLYVPTDVIGSPDMIGVAASEHSRKPDEFYREARWMSPPPHLSLFQRRERDGWYGWGDQYEAMATDANPKRGMF